MFHNKEVTLLSLCDTTDQNSGSTRPFGLVLTGKNSNNVHGYKYYTSYKQDIDNIHQIQFWGPLRGKKKLDLLFTYFNLGLKLPQKCPYIRAFLWAHNIRLLILNLSDEYLCNFPYVTKIFPILTLNGKRELLIWRCCCRRAFWHCVKKVEITVSISCVVILMRYIQQPIKWVAWRELVTSESHNLANEHMDGRLFSCMTSLVRSHWGAHLAPFFNIIEKCSRKCHHCHLCPRHHFPAAGRSQSDHSHLSRDEGSAT